MLARSRVLLKGKAKFSCAYICICLHQQPKRRPAGVYRIYKLVLCVYKLSRCKLGGKAERASAPLHKIFAPKVNVLWSRKTREQFAAFMFWMRHGRTAWKRIWIAPIAVSAVVKDAYLYGSKIDPMRGEKRIICLNEPRNDRWAFISIFLDVSLALLQPWGT